MNYSSRFFAINITLFALLSVANTSPAYALTCKLSGSSWSGDRISISLPWGKTLDISSRIPAAMTPPFAVTDSYVVGDISISLSANPPTLSSSPWACGTAVSVQNSGFFVLADSSSNSVCLTVDVILEKPVSNIWDYSCDSQTGGQRPVWDTKQFKCVACPTSTPMYVWSNCTCLSCYDYGLKRGDFIAGQCPGQINGAYQAPNCKLCSQVDPQKPVFDVSTMSCVACKTGEVYNGCQCVEKTSTAKSTVPTSSSTSSTSSSTSLSSSTSTSALTTTSTVVSTSTPPSVTAPLPPYCN